MAEEMARDSFVFYRSFMEAITMLPSEDAYTLMIAVGNYALDGIEPELTGVVKIVWTTIRPQLEANRRKYENGKKGGAPKGSRNNPAGRRGKTEVMPETNRELTIGISKPECSFTAPSLKEVQEFITANRAMVDAKRFMLYYEGKKWQHNGEFIDWKNKIQSWDHEERKRQGLIKGVNVLGVGEYLDTDGNRRYSTTGPVIPSNAPARPSKGHWWNTITNEWCLVA